MDTRVLITLVIIIAIAAVVIVAAVFLSRQKRRQHLKQQFGPEYDRTVRLHGDASRAEAVLLERERRVQQFPIRRLDPADRERYAEEWLTIQRRFVDDPSLAVREADKLVTVVMTARGYPMGDFEQRAADVSVHHPRVVENYRLARECTQRHARGESTTEDLRHALVYFRSLFDELLEGPPSKRAGETHERLAS